MAGRVARGPVTELSRRTVLWIALAETLLLASVFALYVWGSWVYVGTPNLYCQGLGPCNPPPLAPLSTPVLTSTEFVLLAVASLVPLVPLLDPRPVCRALGAASAAAVSGGMLILAYRPPASQMASELTYRTPTFSAVTAIAPIASAVAAALLATVLIAEPRSTRGRRSRARPTAVHRIEE